MNEPRRPAAGISNRETPDEEQRERESYPPQPDVVEAERPAAHGEEETDERDDAAVRDAQTGRPKGRPDSASISVHSQT